MDVLSAVVTLFLVMDPLGNVPLFLSILKTVTPERRRIVLLREIGFAYVVLVAFLLSPFHFRNPRFHSASSNSMPVPATSRKPSRSL
jgi:hypothetical protein